MSTEPPTSSSLPSINQTRIELPSYSGELHCHECMVTETLWVCLTCGVLGCGRYTNKCADKHFRETNHPYSLEIVTQRVWGYEANKFVQHDDFLTCPVMQRLITRIPRTPRNGFTEAASTAARTSGRAKTDDLTDKKYFKNGESSKFPSRDPFLHGCGFGDGSDGSQTQPKKALMVSEEYETLLQSALEEQSLHFEGELSRLRTELSSRHVHTEALSEEEIAQIDALRSTMSHLRLEADELQIDLIELHAHEAGQKAISQKLLRGQVQANEIMDKINQQVIQEHNEGKMQIQELEQQIADLDANLKMRDRIMQDQELKNSRIFGTTTSKSQKRGGKKNRRSSRR